MSAETKHDPPSLEDGLREIDRLVEATPPEEEPPTPEAPDEEPDVEAVARDLGISVAEVRAMMESRF